MGDFVPYLGKLFTVHRNRMLADGVRVGVVQEFAYEALAAFGGQETGQLMGEPQAVQFVVPEGAAVFAAALGAAEKSGVDDAVHPLERHTRDAGRFVCRELLIFGGFAHYLSLVREEI